MRPPRQRAKECQDQDHDQYNSKHVLLLVMDFWLWIYEEVQPLPKLHRVEPLHRDADRNSNVGIPAVEQIVAVIDIGDVDVVGVVPVIRPVSWPRVNHAEPIAVVLEAGISAHNEEGETVNAEPVVLAKISAEAIVRNAVAVVATTLLPVAVVGIPAL
jgi:hypothetical protein